MKEHVCKDGWISVEDKMPKDCGEDWVLVLPYDGNLECIPSVAEYRKGHWWGHTLCTEDDCIDGENSPFVVKYWRPITNSAASEAAICREFTNRLIDGADLLQKWNQLSDRGRIEFDQVIMCQPTIPAIELTGIKHVSKYELGDHRSQCCIADEKLSSVCDTSELEE